MSRQRKFKAYYMEFLRYVRPPEPSAGLLGAVPMIRLKRNFSLEKKCQLLLLVYPHILNLGA